MDTPLIVLVLQRYYEGWQPPRDTGRQWISCKCPAHGDDSPSASVSFQFNAFKCHSCTYKGDAIALIKTEEGMTYREALELATQLAPGSYRELPPKPGRKSWGDLPSDEVPSVPVDHPRDGRKVPSRVRGRPTPWT